MRITILESPGTGSLLSLWFIQSAGISFKLKIKKLEAAEAEDVAAGTWATLSE
jgi:hypothetical protein